MSARGVRIGLMLGLMAELFGCDRVKSSPVVESSPQDEAAVARWDVVSAGMTFSPSEFSCSAGQRVVVRLTNNDRKPGSELVHSLVVLKLGSDLEEFGRAVLSALPAENYIPAAFRDLVLASTQLVGPGESSTMTFTAPTAAGRYPVLCAFPGHCIIGMQGFLTVK